MYVDSWPVFETACNLDYVYEVYATGGVPGYQWHQKVANDNFEWWAADYALHLGVPHIYWTILALIGHEPG